MQISVVIPTYNRAHTVSRAIDSVLQQTATPLEILVVDDGSTDSTDSMLRKRYGSAIQLHCRQHNTGVSAARNYAVSQSRGDWIAFLDSDDEWLPRKLESQIIQLQQTPHSLCHTNEIWIRNGVRVNPMKKHAKQGGRVFQRSLDMCVISPSSVVLEKSVFTAAGGFDETLPACEDYDLWLKITAQDPVLYLEAPLLVKYGGHEDQLSRKYWGMDRFRVQALHNLLESGNLSVQQRELVCRVLLKKLRILRKGADKHANTALLAYCDQLHATVQQTADSTTTVPRL